MQSVVGRGSALLPGFTMASYASGLILTVVHRATRGQGGQPKWLAQDLDKGSVGLFYLVTTTIAVVNLVYLMASAWWYRFKKSDDEYAHTRGDVKLDDDNQKKADTNLA